jgi:twitching motility protein PilT
MPGFDNELERIVTELNRAAPGAEPSKTTPHPRIAASVPNALETLLAHAGERNASDLLLVAESPAIARVNAGLSSEDIENLLNPLLTPDQQRELRSKKTLDFSLVRPNGIRCRVNLHYQRGTVAACIRILPARVPSLESLHLPAALAKFIDRRQGLILVTGPTGCGKTTTLAALIDLLNKRQKFHIVTIEYHYSSALSVVEQIEVGRDTPDFGNSLRSILRQNPDAILLHTNDTSQAVSRILDSFPAANQAQIRQQLSLALTAVIAQQLVPGTDGASRFPAVEVMAATDAVRALIRRGDDHQLRLQLSIGRADGMMTMEQSLAELVRTGRIARETALAHCFRPDDLRLHLE